MTCRSGGFFDIEIENPETALRRICDDCARNRLAIQRTDDFARAVKQHAIASAPGHIAARI